MPGGGGTHPGFGYPLKNGPQELWLSMRSRLEKKGGGLLEGAYSVGAAVFGLSNPRKAS